MDVLTRIEASLEVAIAAVATAEAPPGLVAAVRHAVFPGGARVRPRLCSAVARACGGDSSVLADAAGTAIELLHCASLVHDDLPCFDDAAMRRGRPSVHAAYGAPLAVLAGDALIVLAFQSLVAVPVRQPQRLGTLLDLLARGVGLPHGIAAGQAWECEPQVPLHTYQQAKTGALFAAATMAGAAAAGQPHEPWRRLGERLGEAYQVADDIRDVAADPQALGKPTGRDGLLGRPSSAATKGLAGALAHFQDLVDEAADAVPSCRGHHQLQTLVRSEAERLVPAAWHPMLAASAA